MSCPQPADALARLTVNGVQIPDADHVGTASGEKPDIDRDPRPRPVDRPDGVLEQWFYLTSQIIPTTEEAFENSPTGLDISTPLGQSAFQSYWRGVFTNLEKKVTADDKIPEYVTSPPCEYFNIFFFKRRCGGMGGCECGMPQPKPNIRIRNPNGVTKGDVVKALTSYLYGSDHEMPIIFDEWPGGEYPGIYDYDDEPEPSGQPGNRTAFDKHNPMWGPDDMVLRYQFPALVYNLAWMHQGEYVFPEDMREKGGPIIWLYCCTPEEFKVRMKEREEMKKYVEEQQTEKEPRVARLYDGSWLGRRGGYSTLTNWKDCPNHGDRLALDPQGSLHVEPQYNEEESEFRYFGRQGVDAL